MPCTAQDLSELAEECASSGDFDLAQNLIGAMTSHSECRKMRFIVVAATNAARRRGVREVIRR